MIVSPHRFSSWDRLALVDANCRVGSIPSDSVGTWQAEEDGKHSEAFHNFLLNEQLWLPSTYYCCQSGPPGTWRHPNGNWYRGDYVALPKGWNYISCRALVSDQIDASLLKEDHCAAVAYIETSSEIITSRTVPKPRNLDETAVLHTLSQSPWIAEQLRNVQPQPWDLDVHTHVAAITSDVHTVIKDTYVPPPPSHARSPLRLQHGAWFSTKGRHATTSTQSSVSSRGAFCMLALLDGETARLTSSLEVVAHMFLMNRTSNWPLP